MIVYKITNTQTGQIYFGSSREDDVEQIWARLVNAANNGLDFPLYKEIRIHGEDAFEADEWGCADTSSELRELEREALEDTPDARSLKGYRLKAESDAPARRSKPVSDDVRALFRDIIDVEKEQPPQLRRKKVALPTAAQPESELGLSSVSQPAKTAIAQPTANEFTRPEPIAAPAITPVPSIAAEVAAVSEPNEPEPETVAEPEDTSAKHTTATEIRSGAVRGITRTLPAGPGLVRHANRSTSRELLKNKLQKTRKEAAAAPKTNIEDIKDEAQRDRLILTRAAKEKAAADEMKKVLARIHTKANSMKKCNQPRKKAASKKKTESAAAIAAANTEATAQPAAMSIPDGLSKEEKQKRIKLMMAEKKRQSEAQKKELQSSQADTMKALLADISLRRKPAKPEVKAETTTVEVTAFEAAITSGVTLDPQVLASNTAVEQTHRQPAKPHPLTELVSPEQIAESAAVEVEHANHCAAATAKSTAATAQSVDRSTATSDDEITRKVASNKDAIKAMLLAAAAELEAERVAKAQTVCEKDRENRQAKAIKAMLAAAAAELDTERNQPAPVEPAAEASQPAAVVEQTLAPVANTETAEKKIVDDLAVVANNQADDQTKMHQTAESNRDDAVASEREALQSTQQAASIKAMLIAAAAEVEAENQGLQSQVVATPEVASNSELAATETKTSLMAAQPLIANTPAAARSHMQAADEFIAQATKAQQALLEANAVKQSSPTNKRSPAKVESKSARNRRIKEMLSLEKQRVEQEKQSRISKESEEMHAILARIDARKSAGKVKKPAASKTAAAKKKPVEKAPTAITPDAINISGSGLFGGNNSANIGSKKAEKTEDGHSSEMQKILSGLGNRARGFGGRN
ncbi:GIY-YIG nuclease family protein [Pelagibaculum spongiae]|uniref:GIY-YIG domain-containing protein n=1 Tax=Pelagibaculum spongiae TaxID=2080658 RepID=A0A2V1GXH1_9GAMM|nr:GIY-YIG nuclease family protein [Pelagibaculum spongiae]PVZ68964.1 hypothetical protein DC094_12010 [Pelagibaculum spongiae]